MKVSVIAILILSVSFIPFNIQRTSHISSYDVEPNIVVTTTDSHPTGETHQRCILRMQNTWWMFYSSGGGLWKQTSVDGVNWINATLVTRESNTNDFSVWYDGTYLHYSSCLTTLVYRKGCPNPDGTVTWSTHEQTVTESDIERSMISVNSDGHAFIAGWKDKVGDNSPYVYRNAWNNGSWLTIDSQAIYDGMDNDWQQAVVPISNGKMFAIATVAPIKKTYSRLWNGSAWEAAVKMGDFEGKFSVVTWENVIHTVSRGQGHKWRASNGTWYDGLNEAFGREPASLCLDADNGGLYAFWVNRTSYDVVYQIYNSSINRWQDANGNTGETTVLADRNSTHNPKHVSVTYQNWDNQIGVTWREGTNQYNLMFQNMSLGGIEQEDDFDDVENEGIDNESKLPNVVDMLAIICLAIASSIVLFVSVKRIRKQTNKLA